MGPLQSVLSAYWGAVFFLYARKKPGTSRMLQVAPGFLIPLAGQQNARFG
jgi:hypothetical protein